MIDAEIGSPEWLRGITPAIATGQGHNPALMCDVLEGMGFVVRRRGDPLVRPGRYSTAQSWKWRPDPGGHFLTPPSMESTNDALRFGRYPDWRGPLRRDTITIAQAPSGAATAITARPGAVPSVAISVPRAVWLLVLTAAVDARQAERQPAD